MGRDGFGDDGQQQVVLTLYDSAWHGGLAISCFVCGLGGLGARRAIVGRDGFGDDGQQQVVLTLYDSAWHGGLAISCFVCGLGGLGARQC